MMSENSSARGAVTPPGLFDRLARGAMLRQLTGLRHGRLTLADAAETIQFGDLSDLNVNVRIVNPSFFRRAILGGTLSVADSYLRGDWDCDDLTALFRLFLRNRQAAVGLNKGISRIAGWVQRIYHELRSNSRSGSRNNIHAHYDLGNEFFRLWLDDTMAYSSGYFPRPDSTLREASVEKFDRVCRKLDLRPRDHLLEIGTGWGGFAIHAAQNYGCRITSTTISIEQYELAKARIEAAGVGGRIEVVLKDYRDLTGQFDKLVSIEMIEAVGYRYFDTYFRKCGELLKPDGSFVLQAIVMPERDYAEYLRSVDFIQRYVFPGGCLASVGAMLDSAGRTTDLRFVNCEDFGPHYAETLRRWRCRFSGQLDEVRALGYPERFLRLWHYYLCYCEAAFEERYTGVVQLQMDKPMCRRDTVGSTAVSVRPRPAIDVQAAAEEFVTPPNCEPAGQVFAEREYR